MKRLFILRLLILRFLQALKFLNLFFPDLQSPNPTISDQQLHPYHLISSLLSFLLVSAMRWLGSISAVVRSANLRLVSII